jgi:hypothetical protein
MYILSQMRSHVQTEPDRLALIFNNEPITFDRFGGDREELHVFVEGAAPISRDRLADAVRSTLVGFDEAQIHRVDALPRTPLGKIRRVEPARRLQDGGFRPAPAA